MITAARPLSPALVFAFLSLAAGQTNPPGTASTPHPGPELDAYFQKVLQAQNFVGLGACLIKNGEVVWANSYGYADLEEKIPLRNDHIYHLASLSKTVTATALMQLYEKGLFELDDDIDRYLPLSVRNPNFPDKAITFRMLLTHTGSLEDVTPTGLKVAAGVEYPHGVEGDSDVPLGTLIRDLFSPGGRYYSAEYWSKSEPGTKYSYSNFAFALAGYLVQEISHRDFSEYCRANIFTPLEMTDTGWFVKDVDPSRIIFEYGARPGDASGAYRRRAPFGEPAYPSGNLRTTMADFARFLSIFINKGRYKDRQLLEPETVALISTPQGVRNIPSRTFPVSDIGLPWLITEVEGERLYTMNGFSGSIFANAYFSPKERTAVIYYFTGITMKNMAAVAEITTRLEHTVRSTSWR